LCFLFVVLGFGVLVLGFRATPPNPKPPIPNPQSPIPNPQDKKINIFPIMNLNKEINIKYLNKHVCL